jgi:hypothetical protein
MSYIVTILRTFGGDHHAITEAELESVIAGLPDWVIDPSEETVSCTTSGGDVLWLWFQDGELWTKNPDEEQLALMIQLAERLGARVRGDELETYRTPDEWFAHPDDEEELAERERELLARTQKSKKRHRIITAIKILFLGALAANFVAYVFFN